MNKNFLLSLFVKQNVKYKIYDHVALNSVEESLNKRGKIIGAHTKNLFLKNKKNQFFLFSCLETTLIDLKKLKKQLNIGNISFAKNEFLKSLLGVKPGAVTPFGLINDVKNEVNYYLDKNIIHYKQVNFHPLVNTSTVTLETKDFLKFMKANNKLVNIYNFDNYTLVK